MRKLNKKQKELLDLEYKVNGVTDVSELNPRRTAELVRLNDHETVYQNANRYLFDVHSEKLYGNRPGF